MVQKTYYLSGILPADFKDLQAALPEYRFLFFESTMDIVEKLLDERPDGIICHPKTHVPDGCALMNYLLTSKDPAWNKLPLAAVFHEEDGLEKAAEEAGADLLITYPFDETKLKAQFETFEKKASQKPPKYVNLNYLYDLAGGDTDFVKDMLETFGRKNQEQIIAMEQALSNKNWEELGKISHKAKSSYGFLGIFSLQIAAGMIEKFSFERPDIPKINILMEIIKTNSPYILQELQSE